MMQRTDDPRRVVTLARAQERELRRWLYEKDPVVEGERLVAALRSAADRVETDFDVPVEVVAVGDRSLDDATRAMVGPPARRCQLGATLPVPDRSRCISRSGTGSTTCG